jgi:hypothetical protein
MSTRNTRSTIHNSSYIFPVFFFFFVVNIDFFQQIIFFTVKQIVLFWYRYSVNTIKENSETLLEASRDIGPEINAEKTKYMIMSRHPNSEQNKNIRIANESFEKVEKFKYLGTTLTNQNDIHDEIKSRLNSGNAYSYSVQNLLSYRLI